MSKPKRQVSKGGTKVAKKRLLKHRRRPVALGDVEALPKR